MTLNWAVFPDDFGERRSDDDSGSQNSSESVSGISYDEENDDEMDPFGPESRDPSSLGSPVLPPNIDNYPDIDLPTLPSPTPEPITISRHVNSVVRAVHSDSAAALSVQFRGSYTDSVRSPH